MHLLKYSYELSLLKKPTDFTLPLSKERSHTVSEVTPDTVGQNSQENESCVSAGVCFHKSKIMFWAKKKYFLKYALIEYLRHNSK